MARRAPTIDSYVRRIRSSRHCVRTWIVTSSGIRSSSMIWRTKSKSGWEAEGKPTSISLNPISTSWMNIAFLRSDVHRIDEGLVAVAQIDAAPARRLGQATVGPGAVRQVNRHRRDVFGVGHGTGLLVILHLVSSPSRFNKKQKTPAEAGVGASACSPLSKQQVVLAGSHVIIVPNPASMSRETRR